MLTFGVHYPKFFYPSLHTNHPPAWKPQVGPDVQLLVPPTIDTKQKDMHPTHPGEQFLHLKELLEMFFVSCFFQYGDSWFFSGGWMILDYTLSFFLKIEVVIEIRSLEVGLDISLSRLLCHLCLFSNGMPVFHKRCQSQYHLSTVSHPCFQKKHDHIMTWLWHDTCSVSINKSHLLIRSCWLRNQNMLSMDQVLASEHDFAENIRQVVRIFVLGLVSKRKPVAKTSSSCLVVICIRFCLSDLVRHSKQEGLNTIRQDAENLTEKQTFQIKQSCSYVLDLILISFDQLVISNADIFVPYSSLTYKAFAAISQQEIHQTQLSLRSAWLRRHQDMSLTDEANCRSMIWHDTSDTRLYKYAHTRPWT